MRRLLALAVALPLMAACDDPPDPGTGGLLTAQLWTETIVADGKLAQCTGTSGLMANWLPVGMSDSLPVTDGAAARWAKENSGRLSGALSARDCTALYTALNDGLAPAECAEEGSTCAGDVRQDCLKMGLQTLRFDTDCAAVGMSCVAGACTLGACVTNACDGDTLVTCGADRRKVLFLCGALGLTCGNAGEGLQCVGRGETCTTVDDGDETTPPATLPKCDGGRLTWCLGGHKAIVDCGELTDGRRECKQASLDRFADLAPEELLTGHLRDICGPTGGDCEGSASDCEDEHYLKLCVDGYYEWLGCKDFKTGGCGVSDVTPDRASCTPFPAK